MTHDATLHHRRSIRAKRYDYATHGAYFITICAYERRPLLGKIRNGIVGLTEVGCTVQRVWNELPARHAGVEIDEFIIMPNHIHGIIVLVGAGSHACPKPQQQPVVRADPRVRPSAVTLPAIVQRFKSFTTHLHGQTLWQRNYFEHIVRNDHDLDRIREYIQTNPVRWTLDRENPNREGEDEFDRWMESFTAPGAGEQRAGTGARPYEAPGT